MAAYGGDASSSEARIRSELSSGPDLADRELAPLDKDRILSQLETRWLGRDLRLFAQLDSTNELAISLAQKGESGTVVLAEVQTMGRGRLSRHWESPSGGIWMSLILRPDIPISLAYQINMAISVAVCRAISSLICLMTGIK